MKISLWIYWFLANGISNVKMAMCLQNLQELDADSFLWLCNLRIDTSDWGMKGRAYLMYLIIIYALMYSFLFGVNK